MKKFLAGIVIFFTIMLLIVNLPNGDENTSPVSSPTTSSSYNSNNSSTSTNSNTSSSSHQTSNTTNGTQRVKCSMCNGLGKVKYYYGESSFDAAINGQPDYQYGPCSTCNGTGYVYIKTSGTPSADKVVCPSCGKYVTNLITRKDISGVSRTWCSSCWKEYDDIVG